MSTASPSSSHASSPLVTSPVTPLRAVPDHGNNRPKFFCSESIIVDEADMEDADDMNRVIEESPNGRWSKLDTEIFLQRLPNFDSSHLALDTEKGSEIAWNEIRFVKSSSPMRQTTTTTSPSGGTIGSPTVQSFSSRFESVQALEAICSKLTNLLSYLCQLDHSNILKFYDYWIVNKGRDDFKLVVVTEYSTGGSLKKILDSAKRSKVKIKQSTYKRWLNQIIYSFKCLYNGNISFFQGNLTSDTIFIGNSGVIKLAPSLLSLIGVCELTSTGLITCANPGKKLNIDLTSELRMKDFRSIGRLAIEIFTAHIKTPHSSVPNSPHHLRQSSFDQWPKSSSSSSTSQQAANHNASPSTTLNFLNIDLSFLDDEAQRDFCLQCFDPQATISCIWYHPLINTIHSLKVLSVFSILNFFQEERKHNTLTNNSANNSVPNSNKESTSSFKIPKLSLNNEIIHDHIRSKEDQEFGCNKENLSSSKETISSPTIVQSGSSSSLTKLLQRSNSHHQSDRRKVSLTFLTNYHNLKIPQDFFSLLEDIRSGLYPRLFKDNLDLKEATSSNLRSIAPSTCIDFVIQAKQIIDRRTSSVGMITEPELSSSVNARKSVFKSSENLLANGNSVSSDQLGSSDDTFMNESGGGGVSSDSPPQSSIIKYPIENRRLTSESCQVKISENDSSMIQLSLELKFNDGLSRSLHSYFPIEFLDYLKHDYDQESEVFQVGFEMPPEFRKIRSGSTFIGPDLMAALDPFSDENNNNSNTASLHIKVDNICTHLTNELVDNGLINFKDHHLIFDLFAKTIKEYLTMNQLEVIQ